MRGIESMEGVQIHPPLKAKIAAETEKLCGKTKGRERNRSSRGRSWPPRLWLPPQAARGRHHARGGHHVLAVLAFGRPALSASRTPRFGASFGQRVLLVLGHFGPCDLGL